MDCGRNTNPWGLPPPDPAGGYNIGSKAQAEKNAAWAYLGRDYTMNYQSDKKSLRDYAIFLRIPHAKTGDRWDWKAIKEELLLYGHEYGTPITDEKRQMAKDAIEEAQMFYERVHEPEVSEPGGDR